MVNFYLLRCICFAIGLLLVACSPPPPSAEPVHAPAPPTDDIPTADRTKIAALASQYGALGHYYDEADSRYVVVFPRDAAVPTREQIEAELHTEVRVKQIEMTKGIYDSIKSELAHLQDMHPGSTYSVHLDLLTGRAILFSDLPQDALEPLLQKYAEFIEFNRGSIRTD